MRQQTKIDGKKVWAVDVTETRTAQVFILADTREEAEKDAYELASDVDWDDIDQDVFVQPRRYPLPEIVWTGGTNGEWRGLA